MRGMFGRLSCMKAEFHPQLHDDKPSRHIIDNHFVNLKSDGFQSVAIEGQVEVRTHDACKATCAVRPNGQVDVAGRLFGTQPEPSVLQHH